MSIFPRILNRLFPRRPPLAGSLADWARRHDYEVQTLVPSRVGKEVPWSRTGKVSEELAYLSQPKLPERVIVAVTGCSIRGRDGYVVLPDGSYLLENTTEKWTLGNPAYFQRFQTRARPANGAYFSLLGMHCREHYHWLHDSLTLLHRVSDHLPEETRFLVPNGLSSEKIDLLEGFGVDPGKMVVYRPEEPLKPQLLYLATPAAPHRFDDPEAVSWVREKLRHHYQLTPKLNKSLFISRENAATRQIVNMREIAPILKENGYEIVLPEKMSLREQARLFSEAAHIAGPHGAGHTNLLFAHDDCEIVELFAGQIGFRSYYASLALAIGMPYRFLILKSIDESYDPREMVFPSSELHSLFI